jgi:RNA recognition motif-containing protein
MKKLFVGNLPSDANEASVTKLFSDYGTVRSINLATDIFSGKCKGFCFIEMEGHEARAAQNALDGFSMEGSGFLKVRFEQPRNRGRGRR